MTGLSNILKLQAECIKSALVAEAMNDTLDLDVNNWDMNSLIEKGMELSDNGLKDKMDRFSNQIDDVYSMAETNCQVEFLSQGDTQNEFKAISDCIEEYVSEEMKSRLQEN
ncbi:MAG: hypothetical protein QM500_19835 [Methylococcales bacterium]